MPYNSSETRRRLLEAAIEEFSAHGIVGARVDAIAKRARATKQAIYAYYGSKDELFLAAFEDRIIAFQQAIRFDEDDLAEYAGRMFDAYADSPQTWRITVWSQLEQGDARRQIPVLDTAFTEYAARIAIAQNEGRVTRRYAPATILGLARALALTWQMQPPELGASMPEERRSRRAIVVASMRALLEDAHHE